MAQKKKKPDPAKRARNSDGTYKADNKSTPNVNEAYESPKPGTKATTRPRNPAAKERAASTTKKPAAKKPVAKKAVKKTPTYAPKVRPTAASPVEEMLTKDIKPAETMPPTLSRYTPPPPKKKGRVGKMWSWLVGE